MSLRARLTTLYTALLAIVLAVFGVAGYWAFARAQHTHVDDVLRTRASEIQASVAVDGHVEIRGPSLVHPATYIQLIDTDGEVTDRSESLGDVLLPVDAGVRSVAAGAKPAHFTNTSAGGVPMRMFVVPVRALGQTRGAVQLAIRLDDVKAALDRLKLVLVLGGLGGVTLAAALGWAVARSALRPVDDIAAAASEIGHTQDLTRRVTQRRGDELGKLAEAFNGMLDRLQRARDDLERTLEGQRRFLADVSHELRTPLTTMRGNLEVTMRDTGLPAEERAAAIADALGEAERMSRMVEDLLELARSGVSQDRPPALVPLGGLVRDAVEAARPRANGLGLTCVIDGDPVVAGDPDQLRRLADNLIDNAIKYTPAGEVEATAKIEGGDAVLRVRDTGPGMTPEEASRAFERFWRGDRARGEPGSGLGLAIARAVAEKHGGSISLESRPGAGTTLTVRLPLALRPLSDVVAIQGQEVGR